MILATPIFSNKAGSRSVCLELKRASQEGISVDVVPGERNCHQVGIQVQYPAQLFGVSVEHSPRRPP